MASDDGALSTCVDADWISLPGFLAATTEQSVVRCLLGSMRHLEFGDRRLHGAPDPRNGPRRGLAPSVAQRHAAFLIKTRHLGSLHESTRGLPRPVAHARY